MQQAISPLLSGPAGIIGGGQNDAADDIIVNLHTQTDPSTSKQFGNVTSALQAAAQLRCSNRFKDSSTSGAVVRPLNGLAHHTSIDLSALQPGGTGTLHPAKLEEISVSAIKFRAGALLQLNTHSSGFVEHPTVTNLGAEIVLYTIKKNRIRVLCIGSGSRVVLEAPEKTTVFGIWSIEVNDNEKQQLQWLIAAATTASSAAGESICFWRVFWAEEHLQAEWLGKIFAPGLQTFSWSTTSEGCAAAWITQASQPRDSASFRVKRFSDMARVFSQIEDPLAAHTHAVKYGIIARQHSISASIVAQGFSLEGSIYATLQLPETFDPTFNAFELRFEPTNAALSSARSGQLAFPLPPADLVPSSSSWGRPSVSFFALVSDPNAALSFAKNGNCPRSAIVGFDSNTKIGLLDFENRTWRHFWTFDFSLPKENINLIRYFHETATMVIANSARSSALIHTFSFSELPFTSVQDGGLKDEVSEAVVFHTRLVDSSSTGLPWSVKAPSELREFALPDKCMSFSIARENFSELILFARLPGGIHVFYLPFPPSDTLKEEQETSTRDKLSLQHQLLREPPKTLDSIERLSYNLRDATGSAKPSIDNTSGATEQHSSREKPIQYMKKVPRDCCGALSPPCLSQVELSPADAALQTSSRPSSSHTRHIMPLVDASKSCSEPKATSRACMPDQDRTPSAHSELERSIETESKNGLNTPASAVQKITAQDAADMRRALAEMESSVTAISNVDLRRALRKMQQSIENKIEKFDAGMAARLSSTSPTASHLTGSAVSAIAHEISETLSGQFGDLILPELHAGLREIVPQEVRLGVAEAVQETLPDELHRLFTSNADMTRVLTNSIAQGIVSLIRQTAVDVVSKVFASHFEEFLNAAIEKIEGKIESHLVNICKSIVVEQSQALQETEKQMPQVNTLLYSLAAQMNDLSSQNRDLQAALAKLSSVTVEGSQRGARRGQTPSDQHSTASTLSSMTPGPWIPIETFRRDVDAQLGVQHNVVDVSKIRTSHSFFLNDQTAAVAPASSTVERGIWAAPLANSSRVVHEAIGTESIAPTSDSIEDFLLAALSSNLPELRLPTILRELRFSDQPPSAFLQDVSQPVLLALVHRLGLLMKAASESSAHPALPFEITVPWAEAAARLLQPADITIAEAFRVISKQIAINIESAWHRVAQRERSLAPLGAGSVTVTSWWSHCRLGDLMGLLRPSGFDGREFA